MQIVNDLPNSLTELFQQKENDYRIIDYSNEMDNIQSTEAFIEHINIHSENIIYDAGTQLVLHHPDFDYLLKMDASGDFFSHSFTITMLPIEELENFIN